MCSGTPKSSTPSSASSLSSNFLHDVAPRCPTTGTPRSIIEDQVEQIREQVGDADVICGLSGGVDSAVAAALVHKAIGDQLTCVFVDHGLLRKGEVEQVEHDFVAAHRHPPHHRRRRRATSSTPWQASPSPERKRKIIGEKFIRTFEKAQRQVLEEAGARGKEVKFLVQGTLYPDVVESGGGDGAANIKSHHNVGGLPEDIKFQLIEPLRTLFKDEVRAIGTELGLPDEIVWRQPFPGPGLGIRIIGEITKERLDLLREADAIAREELSTAGLDRDIWQCPVVLLADVHSVGVQGDERTYGSPDRPAPGQLGGRHDRRLVPCPLRCARHASPRASPTNAARSTASCSIARPSLRPPLSGSKLERILRNRNSVRRVSQCAATYEKA